MIGKAETNRHSSRDAMRLRDPRLLMLESARPHELRKPRACIAHCFPIGGMEFRPSGNILSIPEPARVSQCDHSESPLWTVGMYRTQTVPEEYPDVIFGERVVPWMVVHEHVAPEQA
jgi:hypothetical protein